MGSDFGNYVTAAEIVWSSDNCSVKFPPVGMNESYLTGAATFEKGS